MALSSKALSAPSFAQLLREQHSPNPHGNDAVDVVKVFSWGWAQSGQLGIGHFRERVGASPIPNEVKGLSNRRVKTLVCGSRCTAALTNEGRVFTWGKGEDGQLGHGTREQEWEPRLVEALSTLVIEVIACRGSHVAAIDTKGHVWAWGKNNEGQLGVGKRSSQDGCVPTRLKTFSPQRAVDVCCGKEFTVCLTASGEVWTWGCGEDGQLGHGNVQSCAAPCQLKQLPLVEHIGPGSIACGSRHVLAAAGGKLFAWGWNRNGQLGVESLAKSSSSTPVPVKLWLGFLEHPLLPNTHRLQVACGFRHSACIVGGQLYLWGWGEHGQLGNGGPKDEAKPKLTILATNDLIVGQGAEVTGVALGGAHTLIAVRDQGFFACGRNDDGQLGCGDAECRYLPTRVNPPPGEVTALAAGWAHSLIVTSSVDLAAGDVAEYLVAPLSSSISKLLQSALQVKKGDWDAFFALFMQVLLQLMVIRQLCAGVLSVNGSQVAQGIVLEGILPGVAMTLLVSNIMMVLQAAVAMQRGGTGQKELTAQPHGINSMLLFAYIQLILRPTVDQYGDPEIAWGACLACAFFSGALQLVCVPFAKQIREVIPAPALFSALAGTSLTFLTLDFTFQIFERPVTALPPLIIIFISFSAGVRLPFGLPGGLYALLMGAALQEICKMFPGLQPLPETIETDVIHLCVPKFQGDIILRGLEAGWAHMSVALPLSILNLVNNLASLESAHAAGDQYDFCSSLMIDSLATMFGALVGSPFPTAIFIGHPAYKKMGARTGYLLINSVTVSLVAISGATSLFLLVCPLESVVTVLLWIGITITAQAFTSTPRGSAGAVTIGLIPGIAAWVSGELQKVLTPSGSDDNLNMPTLASLLQTRPELFLAGLLSLRQGYLLLSLVLSSLYHHIEERRFGSASRWALIAAALSGTGLMHAFKVEGNNISTEPAFSFQDSEGSQRRLAFTVAYLVVAGLLAVGSFFLLGSDEDTQQAHLQLGQCLQLPKASARSLGSSKPAGESDCEDVAYDPPKFVPPKLAADVIAVEEGMKRVVSGGA